MRSRNASLKAKKKIFKEYVLTVVTYGSETWVLNKAMEEVMSVAQRKMETIMFGIPLRDRKCNTWIRHQTETEDIVTAIRRNKHRRAEHMARFMENRWTIRATECSLIPWKRLRGPPITRRCNDFTHHLGSIWLHLACAHQTTYRVMRELGFRTKRQPVSEYMNSL